ncbi:aceric acid hydrolase [Leeuwenhoekiella palythoae]|uniref:aceric acid hydrolase n=1 Tax=Leeuwenhoekiella palythoae TaxID=573501 RepID=UPI0035159AF3
MNKYVIFTILLGGTFNLWSQNAGVTDTSNSPFIELKSVDLGAVQWTDGFWKEQINIENHSTIPYMWDLYHQDKTHAYLNFEIAAGLLKGKHEGPSFHDGDFYKILEGMAASYAASKDADLNKKMDQAIALIAKVQREDGYLHTPVLIEERWGTLGPDELQKQLGFEKYNMGHLMTAACIHHRSTGKSNFLNIAIGVADYLYDFYKKASPELARNAICPSHYMGVIEMYRTTQDPRYLELAKNLIDIRGTTTDGTDDNQDRIPFREQTTAMGHAVRANYLYAGVADLYAETGEALLLKRLNTIWEDITQRKMYITGACGALYDGVSPDGTSYNPTEVQKIHQAYGRPYQLPNATAHTETCANIGNLLFNWRMFQVTGDAKYMDILELTLYNSILSGISLDGKNFNYNNPLAVNRALPFEQRWGNQREGYIALSNCCAPNVTRTLAESSNYAYSLSKNGLFVNLYGTNHLKTKTANNEIIEIEQQTDYPWNGTIQVKILNAPKDSYSLNFRIPEWCTQATLKINGDKVEGNFNPSSFKNISQIWKRGDLIELELPMKPVYMEANPLVEEVSNKVALKRGPLVYCLESQGLPKHIDLNAITINLDEAIETEKIKLQNRTIVTLKTSGFYIPAQWKNKLYQPLNQKSEALNFTLNPYYTWGNRGVGDMTVWLSR